MMMLGNAVCPPVVSIHAPAWGATAAELASSMVTLMFQSTRPRGARQGPRISPLVVTRFQSTRPRGARHGSGISASELQRFNPRARVGRDADLERRVMQARVVSIHAPAWGATC